MTKASEIDSGQRDRRVLVVDDDRDFAEGLELLLTAEGHRVVLAHSAGAAREALAGSAIDVALIDIRLADSSGINLISDLRALQPEILCVVITAFASADTAIEALHAGAYDYLCKPCHRSDLFATLERCFERLDLSREKAAAEAALRERNEELEQINRRLHLIVEGMQSLTGCTTIRALCPMVLGEMARNLSAAGGSVYLREGGRLVLKHALDPGHAPQVISLPLPEDSVFGQALSKGRPVLLANIVPGQGIRSSGWRGYRDPSLLAFPLLGEEREEIGVLSLHAKRDPPFTERDRDVGMILVSFICETIRTVQALEELANSEARFRSLVENSPLCIHEMDVTGKLTAMNRAGIEMMRLADPDRIEAVSYLDVVASQDRDRVAGLLQKARHGTVRDFEFVANGGDGSRIYTSCFAPLCGPGGEVQKIMGITQDITERKQAEEQLRQAQKMEAVGQLTGGVAHDFNNLLSVVLGNVGLLEEGLARDPGQELPLEAIRRAVLRGAALTQRLLAYSRQQPLQPKVIDLSTLVDGMMDMLRRTLGETIKIETVAAADLQKTFADPGQVENALLNLAINARDAMPDGGTLRIEVANAELDALPSGEWADAVPGNYVVLSVSDTGIGMSPDVAEHCFEPFFTTKDVGKGSGLGLSMIYGFVRQSGGHIAVDSQEGLGTTLRIYLPQASPGDARAEPDPAVEEPRARGEVVLVVEDDPDVRELSVNLLGHLGYQVLEAEDGRSALAALREAPRVDLLLTDAVLPGGMSGPQFLEEATRLRGNLKALLMSGYPLKVVEQQGEIHSGIELLQKPFHRLDLAQKIRSVLDSPSS